MTGCFDQNRNIEEEKTEHFVPADAENEPSAKRNSSSSGK